MRSKNTKIDVPYLLVLFALALMVYGIAKTLPEAIDHNLGRLSAPVGDEPAGFDRYGSGISQIEAHNRIRQELGK